MVRSHRYVVSAGVTILIFLLGITSTTFVGANELDNESKKDKASIKRIEAMLRQVLEENRALRGQVDELKAENALFRSTQIDLLGRIDAVSKDQSGLFGQLDDVKGILSSFDERLSSFPSLEPSKQSKSSIWSSLSDAFKPASAGPLLDTVSQNRYGGSLLSPRDASTQGLDLAPSNPLGMPGATGGPPRGDGSILLTPALFQGVLPQIPHLDAGYLYNFGNSVRSGRLTLDLLAPVGLSEDSVVFGEVHNEWRDFWKTVTRGANHRVDLSIGGGYRTILGGDTMVGVNAFYDTTRLGRRWYPSGGVGLETAALIPGGDEVDLTFNWYGNMFRSDVLANVFRRGPSNYDFQAGYSHELWDGGPDLRLSGTGYRFSSGSGVFGWRAATELTTRDRMFTVKYQAAHDRVNRTYHTVGAFVKVGLRLGALLDGESPFEAPEPIFKSPRNLKRLLTEKTRRRWGGPASIVLSAARGGGGGDGDGDEPACHTDIDLTGPLVLPDFTRFAYGAVPDITNCGFSGVQISWGGLGTSNSREVIFLFCDGNEAWFASPRVDMSVQSGSVTRALSNSSSTAYNLVHYHDQFMSSIPLTIPAGGWVHFEFY
jgi:hypothetical protein